MKKQQVRNLQDEFTNLFSTSPPPITGTQQSEVQVYYPQTQSKEQNFNSGTFNHLPYSESEQDDDLFDQVDEVLGHGDQSEEVTTRREVMLNFKVNELKLICKNLRNANYSLADRVRQLEQPRSQIVSESSMDGRSMDLTVIQQDFVELEEELTGYKAQLSRYQQMMTGQLGEKQRELGEKLRELEELREEVGQLRGEVGDSRNLRGQLQRLEQQLGEKDRVILMLERRNQELLLQIEEGREWEGGRSRNKHDNSFNEKISYQMESMIDKLLKELKFEKKNSSKNLMEIRRLSSELFELQGILKQKNKKIYQLQFALLKVNKVQQKEPVLNFRQKERAPYKQDYSQSSSGYQVQDHLSSYLPHRASRPHHLLSPKKPEQDNPSSKNRANRSYEKTRMSAEREGAVIGSVGTSAGSGVMGSTNGARGIVSLNKTLSFTLMDLLNREFKIRQAEKEIIACRIIDLYSRKIMQQLYENLIPEQIEIYNFSSQNPAQIKVRANLMLNKNERQQATESALLYNMSFILDTLLNQVEVVDAFVENSLDLNINDYISQLEGKPAKEEKYKSLQELAHSIESYYLPH